MTPSVSGLLDRCLTFAGSVLAGIPADARARPTPCPGYRVEDLAAHLIGRLDWFAVLPLGGPLDPRGVTDPVLDGESLRDPFARAAGTVRSVWTPRRMLRVFELPSGALGGEELVGLMILELLGHGWDLAVATGSPVTLPEDLAEEGLAVATELGEVRLRAPGMMGPPVPVKDDAPAPDRLVAFLGRNPAWLSSVAAAKR